MDRGLTAQALSCLRVSEKGSSRQSVNRGNGAALSGDGPGIYERRGKDSNLRGLTPTPQLGHLQKLVSLSGTGPSYSWTLPPLRPLALTFFHGAPRLVAVLLGELAVSWMLPRASQGLSSPGGGSSLGEPSSALVGPGGATTTSSSSRGTAYRPSSGSGMSEAVPLALLLSSQKASTTVTAMARTLIPTPKALPLAPLACLVLDGPTRRPTFPRASMACPTASLRLVLLLCPKCSHMLLSHPSLRPFHYRPGL